MSVARTWEAMDKAITKQDLKKIKLVLPNHTETDEDQLMKVRNFAIEKYRKAEESINRAEITRRQAEDIVRACNSRIRLLKLLSSYANP
jgi:hypothetical protein